MSEAMRVFVNERAVTVAAEASALDAVTALDPALAARVAAGEAYLTDGRGIRCEPADRQAPGAILRVIVSARGARDADA